MTKWLYHLLLITTIKFCSAWKRERIARNHWSRFNWPKDYRNSHTCLSHYFSHLLVVPTRYLHTCNPLASYTHFIYEAIASECASEYKRKDCGATRRGSFAIKFISRSRLSPYLNLVRRNILTLIVFIVTNNRSPRERYKGRRERGRYVAEDTRVCEFVERMTKACSFTARR